jgi:hypothetical protein
VSRTKELEISSAFQFLNVTAFTEHPDDARACDGDCPCTTPIPAPDIMTIATASALRMHPPCSIQTPVFG